MMGYRGELAIAATVTAVVLPPSSVNQKNDLLKLISVEKFLLDLAPNKLYLSYATCFLIQFICTRYLLIQFVTNHVIF